MAAVKGGKTRKDQTFHCHGGAKQKNIRTGSRVIGGRTSFRKELTKRKHKSTALHRSAIRRELRRVLQAEEGTTNTSLGGILQGTAAAKETFTAGRTVIRTAKRTRSVVKQVKHFKMLHPKEKLIQVSFRKKQCKIVGKDKKKQVARAGIGLSKDFGRYTKEAVVASLDTRGTTNTGAGSIHMTVRATEVTVDTVRTGKKAYRTVKRIREFRRKSKLGKKAAKAAASAVKQGAKKKGMAALTSGMKTIMMKQPVVMIGALVAMLLVGMLTSSTVSSGIATIGANMILMDEETAAKYQAEMQVLEESFQSDIDHYKTKPGYDDIRIDYMCESGELKPNWQELLAIMTVEFEQNLSFSPEEQQRMGELFGMMNVIETREERYHCGGCCSCGDRGTHCHGHVRLIVQVYAYGMDDISLNLDEDEMEWARNLATSDLSELFPGICPPNESIPPEILEDLIANAPASSATREEIRETALSLVGRVKYFWGGKSSAGWNAQWGKSVQVTSPGNSTTGTCQPYGLDCSGFVDWVYKTAGVGSVLSGGSSYQWNASYAITENELQVGDLVFKQPPGRGVNHVGIYIGRDKSGKKQYCHCAWSQGVTVDSYKGFKYYRRPIVKFD